LEQQINQDQLEESKEECFYPQDYVVKRRSTIQPVIEFPVREHQNSNELLAPVTEGEED
jgi:hypothetical protein